MGRARRGSSDRLGTLADLNLGLCPIAPPALRLPAPIATPYQGRPSHRLAVLPRAAVFTADRLTGAKQRKGVERVAQATVYIRAMPFRIANFSIAVSSP